MPKASVKVMNSYDYCHFEVVLGSDEDLSLQQVNELRKSAQRLVDNAIRQYQVAKSKATRRAELQYERRRLEAEVAEIEEKPESERTAEEKAKVKVLEDHAYWSQHDYDYGDDEDRDYGDPRT